LGQPISIFIEDAVDFGSNGDAPVDLRKCSFVGVDSFENFVVTAEDQAEAGKIVKM